MREKIGLVNTQIICWNGDFELIQGPYRFRETGSGFAVKDRY